MLAFSTISEAAVVESMGGYDESGLNLRRGENESYSVKDALYV